MRAKEFDVLVIGGGVAGAGAALDAARRGLSVALVEANDYASGTSSKSSKLIHGGLRYLEMLDFKLVREALLERSLLAGDIAPHLVKPVSFMFPVDNVRRRLYVGMGVVLYDALAMVGSKRKFPRHRHMTRRSIGKMFPGLAPDVMSGAVRYYDAQTDDARYVVTLLRTAAMYGAQIANYAKVTTLKDDDGAVRGAIIADLEDGGSQFEIRAKTVVSATGVWSERAQQLATDTPALRVAASKGVHIVVPKTAIDGHCGLITQTEKSVLFVIPWGRHWIIGTTDTPWPHDVDNPVATDADVEYLLDQTNRLLATPLQRSDIKGVFAGLRPLLSRESAAGDKTTKLSREHAVAEPVSGLFVLAGGKFTTYRVMAADVIDAVCKRLGVTGSSVTSETPLVGADGYGQLVAAIEAGSVGASLPKDLCLRLADRYGTEARELIDMVERRPAFGDRADNDSLYLIVELLRAVTHEGALHPDDVLARRTRLIFESGDGGLSALDEVVAILGSELEWSAERAEVEACGYRALIEAERSAQNSSADSEAIREFDRSLAMARDQSM